MKTVITVFLLSLSIAFAGDLTEQAKSLKGIEKIGVGINIRHIQNAERFGLREDELAQIIKYSLDQYKIKQVPLDDIHKTPGKPTLKIEITPMIDVKDRACAISVRCYLTQTVTMVRDESVVLENVTTWDKNSFALIKPSLLLPGVQERLETSIKDFIKDYYEANGKEFPSSTPPEKKKTVA